MVLNAGFTFSQFENIAIGKLDRARINSIDDPSPV